MFLRRLMSFSSSFHPRGRPALCWGNSRSGVAYSSSNLQQFIPGSHPWWSVQEFPPWPPRLLHPHPPVRLFFAGRTFQPLNFSRGSWRSLHISAGRMMEFPDREYPNKRLKNREEKGGQVGGAPRETKGRAEEGGSKRDYSLRPNHHFRVGNHDKTKSRDSSMEKHAERTKSEKKGSRDGTPNQHSHPPGSTTQPPKSKPVPDQVPEHKPNPWFKRKAEEELSQKPNPWFKGRAEGELGGPRWKETGPAEQLKDGGDDAAKWTLQYNPSTTSQTSNVWQADQVHRPPPSAGTHLPVKRTQTLFYLFHFSCNFPKRAALLILAK